MGGGPRVAVSTAAFHADTGFAPRLVPLSQRFERNKNVSSPSTRKTQYCGEPTWPCTASDRPGSNCESCVWRAVSSHSSHHPYGVFLAQFSLYFVHTGGLKSHSFYVHFLTIFRRESEIVDNTRHFVTDISRLRPTKACLGAGVRFRAQRRHRVC